jgi:AmmeMemoRadiSam system protein B
MIYVRAPIVAGMFYDLEPERLKKQIEGCFNHPLGPKEKLLKSKQKIIAAVAPHAGYMASGPVQAWTYSKIEKANYIIVGPNHSGFGSRFAIMKNGLWKTPLGGVSVDENLANKLENSCKLIRQDAIPHQSEHSIEVQLPFLQYKFGNDFKFVPLCILSDLPSDSFLENCNIVGDAIAKAVKESKEKWILIASSDFSHYIPQERAMETDKKVINAIKKLDERLFFKRIQQLQASVCGYGPIAVTMIAAKGLGAKNAKLLKYATSGDTTGDISAVVGYASIEIY